MPQHKAPLIADGLVKVDFGGGDAAIATGFPVNKVVVNADGVQTVRTEIVEQWILFKGAYTYDFQFPLAAGGTLAVSVSSVAWPRRLPNPGVDQPDSQASYSFVTLTSESIDADAFFAEAKRGVNASSGKTAWYATATFAAPQTITAAPVVDSPASPLFAERIFPRLSVLDRLRIHVGSAPYGADLVPAGATARRRTHLLYRADKVKLPADPEADLISWATTSLPSGVTDLQSWANWAFSQIHEAGKDTRHAYGDVYELSPAQWLGKLVRPTF